MDQPERLRRLRELFVRSGRPVANRIRILCFSAAGFDRRLTAAARNQNVKPVDPEQLYAGSAKTRGPGRARVGENTPMGVRDDFLMSAETAVELLAEPAVAARWTEPSALRDYRTGGLATHLASQLFQLGRLAPSSRSPISLMEYFASAAWVGQDADNEVNVEIRQRNENAAADGPEAMLSQVRVALDEARTLITDAPADRVVQMSLTGWALTLDDFLVTRLLELVVHTDDLAASVDLPTPEFPESANSTVVNVLGLLAIRRHGPQAVVRALSRAERAGSTISAL